MTRRLPPSFFTTLAAPTVTDGGDVDLDSDSGSDLDSDVDLDSDSGSASTLGSDASLDWPWCITNTNRLMRWERRRYLRAHLQDLGRPPEYC